MAWMQHRMPVHLNGAVLSDTYIRLTIRLPRNGDKLFLCRAGRHPQLWFTLQTWYLEHENQHRVQVSSPKNPPWPAAMSRFHQRCISSRAQGCTSSNRGFDFEGISLRFPRFGSNKLEQQTRSNKMLAGSPATTKRTLKLPLIFPTRLRPETPMVWPITLQVTNAKLLTWVSTTSTDL